MHLERLGSGASRETWRVDVGSPGEAGGPLRELVARVDSGGGPLSGSVLDLRREAVVYAALAGSVVRIPRLVASREDGSVLLLERMPGSEAFRAIEDGERRRKVACDYMAALAELHCLDSEALELPGIARPRDGPEHARCELRLWREIFADCGVAGDPLLELAFAWLDRAAPARSDRTSLCHGDAGPGNFLFDGERVTALLDWEFAHLGDPLDDLAWVAVRAQLLGGFGELAEDFQVWSERSGLPVDVERIEYYRALVLVRMAVACLAALGRAAGRESDTTVYTLLLPYLRFLLPGALARSGCRARELEILTEAGAKAVEASPILRAQARPLDPLPPGVERSRGEGLDA